MTKRLLLTGATGLIGRPMLELLSGRGYEVHAVTSRREIPAALHGLASSWHQVDLLEGEATRTLVENVKPEGLIHLAWNIAPGNLHDPVHQEWLDSSRNLIRFFYENGGTRAVVAGTCFEYEQSDKACSEEHTPLSPATLYGICKDALRQYIESFCRENHFHWGWGRVFFVYGPHELPRRFVPSIVLNLLKHQTAQCTHGRQIRDYLHSCDVAGGLLALFESTWNGTCNIGSGNRVTLRQIGEVIGDLTGNSSLLEFGARPAPEGEPPIIVADVTRLQQILKWKPQLTLEEGLRHTVDAWRNELENSSIAEKSIPQ